MIEYQNFWSVLVVSISNLTQYYLVAVKVFLPNKQLFRQIQQDSEKLSKKLLRFK